MSADNHDLNFEGKVVSFSTDRDTLAMKNIEFRMQKNRLFVIGIVPESATRNDWAANRPCAIAWDSIVDYIVFDSEKQYIELIAKSD
ncbi:MAG: hypothetical protein P9F75_16485 [Candidatus Contendobacter sp.]|nr:hypothetical protein [Candidatus Contendobacter sp.]